MSQDGDGAPGSAPVTASESDIRKLIPYGMEDKLAAAKQKAIEADAYAAAAAHSRAVAEAQAKTEAVAAQNALIELTKAEASARIAQMQEELDAAQRAENEANERTAQESRLRGSAEEQAAASRNTTVSALCRAKVAVRLPHFFFAIPRSLSVLQI